MYTRHRFHCQCPYCIRVTRWRDNTPLDSEVRVDRDSTMAQKMVQLRKPDRPAMFTLEQDDGRIDTVIGCNPVQLSRALGGA